MINILKLNNNILKLNNTISFMMNIVVKWKANIKILLEVIEEVQKKVIKLAQKMKINGKYLKIRSIHLSHQKKKKEDKKKSYFRKKKMSSYLKLLKIRVL